MQLDRNLCLGCMEPAGGEAVCPLCGYTEDSPHNPSYLAPGTVLNDRYLTGKLLRNNGESAVYIGYDGNNNSKVLIKEYMPDTLCRRIKDSPVVAVNQDAVAQYKTFMSEFVELNKTLARLRNLSHINPAVDMFGDNNTGYVIFNYIDGTSLTDYLREHGGILSWGEAKKLLPPLFTTLSLIHNAGLVHRGICPENIMFNFKDELILTGFCIADGRTVGTELSSEIYNGYAAPEQYSSGKWQGTWTDVYGISALLYRILTGIVPEDASAREVNDTLKAPSSLNSDIPEKVSDMIMKGMALVSENRIQTVTELVTGLFDEPAADRGFSTQTISIPIQRSSDGVEGFGRNNVPDNVKKQPAKKKNSRPSKSKVFVLAALVSAVVLIVLMAGIMIILDDNSSRVATQITVPTETLADLNDLADSLTYQTVAPEENDSSQPTLNEVENGGSADTTASSYTDGDFYIMNELVGKNYETIKNSPTYSSLVFVPEYEFNEENSKGTIFEQSIAKGESYSSGASVYIKVSLGSRYVTVPPYIGMKSKDYFNLLEGKNIKYEEVSYETKDYANGYVCGVSAEDDEILDLESGDTLIVYIAYNPTPVTETATETEPEPEPEPEITEPDEPEVPDEPEIAEDHDEELITDEPDYTEEWELDEEDFVTDPDFIE